ncbi:MAG TPA: 5'-nucleotidase C-terminal domain-containing protein [Ignavibacteriaceae bacterium]|nr:5'-nucleotidase C-terminal domain-containing protein [Ignavibacteriaceae bacterium]
MKKYILLISSFLLLGIGKAYAQDTLTILHLNDTHSTLSAVGPRNEALQGSQGGIARAATIIGLTKMSDPNVLILHAGDFFIGDLFFNVYFGAAELQILNSLGLDAMTVGNHEWDLTPSTLLGALKASFLPGEGFPLLSANLLFPDTFLHDTLHDYIFPYTIKQIGNIKVGIFGLTTPETNVISLPRPYFIDTNIVDIAAAMVDTLKKQFCNVIIFLSHLGLDLDQTVAGYVPGINVIVGGHDHYLLENPVSVTDPLGGTTWIVQANSNYLDIGKLQLLINGGNVSLLNYEMIPLDESVPEEPAVLNEVNNLIAEIENIYGPVYTQQVGYAASYFEEVADSLMYRGNHDTPIGNLVTDAFRVKTGTDIAIEAGGSTAQPLYEGPLTAADVFRVIGYGFNQTDGLGYRLVTFNINGAALWTALETVLATIELNDELFPQVSGMRIVYDPNKEAGSRLLEVTIGGKALDFDSVYSATGNEFLAAILTDYLKVPISNLEVYGDTTEFQALLDYVAATQILEPSVEGRIVADIAIHADEENFFPKVFSLEQNYPNPFNPVTNFEFRITDLGLVSLKVYDILGKEVAVIVNKELPAGDYKYQWDAAGLSSGVYFYRLQAGNPASGKGFVDTKKLILLR